MEENKKDKHDITLWIITAIFGLFLMLAVFILSGKSAKATNFTYTSSSDSNTYTSLLTYDEGTYFYNDDLKFGFKLISLPINESNNNKYFDIQIVSDIENMNYTISTNSPNVVVPLQYQIANPYLYTYPSTFDNNSFCPNSVGTACGTIGSVQLKYIKYNSSTSTFDSVRSVSFQLYVRSDGLPYLLNNFTPYILSTSSTNPFVSGGGFTQEDVDEAYADGQLDALNTASSSAHGTGTTYSSYSAQDMAFQVSNAYMIGEVDVLNTISNTTTTYDGSNYTGTGTTYTKNDLTYLNDRLNTELTRRISQGNSKGIIKVLNNPSDYNLYTRQQYNDYGTSQYNSGYSAGQLNVLNTAAASTYGTGTTYSSYSSSDIEDEQKYAYAKGIADTTNALAESASGDTTTYGYPYTAGLILDPTIWPDKFAFALYQQSHAYGVGKLEILNYISSHYAGGTNATYTSYSNSNLDTEISGIQQEAYDLGQQNSSAATAAKIEVLNSFSHTLHGTQTTYTDFNSSAIQDEANSIYTAGISYGVTQTGETQSLTRFVPNIFGSLAAAIWPVMTYEVFGISILNILLVVLGIALAYIIIKMLL